MAQVKLPTAMVTEHKKIVCELESSKTTGKERSGAATDDPKLRCVLLTTGSLRSYGGDDACSWTDVPVPGEPLRAQRLGLCFALLCT